jgi:hypothetical protein
MNFLSASPNQIKITKETFSYVAVMQFLEYIFKFHGMVAQV